MSRIQFIVGIINLELLGNSTIDGKYFLGGQIDDFGTLRYRNRPFKAG